MFSWETLYEVNRSMDNFLHSTAAGESFVRALPRGIEAVAPVYQGLERMAACLPEIQAQAEGNPQMTRELQLFRSNLQQMISTLEELNLCAIAKRVELWNSMALKTAPCTPRPSTSNHVS